MENFEILFFGRLCLVLFVAILFLQSGFDKVIDFKGNKSYIKSVFSKTILNPISGFMFISITVMEVLSGLLALIGFIEMVLSQKEDLAIYALMLASITLMVLFGGQRIAKDYGGASGIVPYFILVIFGLFLFAL
jgi:putative oxidoreductase